MVNTLVQRSFQAAVAAAVAKADVVSKVEHKGLRGELREVFVTELLQPFVPAGVEITSGVLVDSWGGESSQTDIIVYNTLVMPPLLVGGSRSVVPVEAADYAIEVKSILTAGEIKDAIKKARRLQSLTPINSVLADGRCVKVFPRPALFAFGTDLAQDGEDELQRYRKYDNAADTAPAVKIICVVGRGYWYFDDGEWIPFRITPEDYQEVVDMLGGMVNTLLGRTERQLEGGWGRYVIGD